MDPQQSIIIPAGERHTLHVEQTYDDEWHMSLRLDATEVHGSGAVVSYVCDCSDEALPRNIVNMLSMAEARERRG